MMLNAESSHIVNALMFSFGSSKYSITDVPLKIIKMINEMMLNAESFHIVNALMFSFGSSMYSITDVPFSFNKFTKELYSCYKMPLFVLHSEVSMRH